MKQGTDKYPRQREKLVRIILALLVTILPSCFPDFKPKEKIITEIHQDGISLKWIDIIGTLDQNFPDYIIIYRENRVDTICKSHNIADLQIKNDTITIGFYGTPIIYDRPIAIRKEICGYKIKINTDF